MLRKQSSHRTKHLLGLYWRNVILCFYSFIVCKKHVQSQGESFYYWSPIGHYSATSSFTLYLDCDFIKQLFLPGISNSFIVFLSWQDKHVLSSPHHGDLPAFPSYILNEIHFLLEKKLLVKALISYSELNPITAFQFSCTIDHLRIVFVLE